MREMTRERLNSFLRTAELIDDDELCVWKEFAFALDKEWTRREQAEHKLKIAKDELWRMDVAYGHNAIPSEVIRLLLEKLEEEDDE